MTEEQTIKDPTTNSQLTDYEKEALNSLKYGHPGMGLPELGLPEEETFSIHRPTLPDTLSGIMEQKHKEFETSQTDTDNLVRQLGILEESLFKTPTLAPGAVANPNEPSIGDVFKMAAHGLGLQAFGGVSPNVASPFPSDADKEQTEELSTQIDAITKELAIRVEANYWMGYQISVIEALPIWLRWQKNLSVDGAIALSRREGSGPIPDTMKIFIAEAMSEVSRDIRERDAEIQRKIQDLSAPAGSLSDMLRINASRSSSQEVINDLVRAGKFEFPESMPPEEARDMLMEMGMSRQEADSHIFNAQYAGEQISEAMKQWNDEYQLLVAEGQKIRSGKILSDVKKAQWMQAASQPAIAILRPIEWWQHNISQVAAGSSYRTFAYLDVETRPGAVVVGPAGPAGLTVHRGETPPHLEPRDRGPRHRFIELTLDRARSEDLSWAESQRLIFEDWDENGFIKFGLEVAADPLTYLGFGLYAKALKPLPYMGKVAGAVGAFERGFAQTMEVPFRAAKFIWVGESTGRIAADGAAEVFRGIAPRTLMQRGTRHGNEAYAIFAKAFSEHIGHPIWKATPEEVRKWGRHAIEEALKVPGAIDDWTRAGKGLLGFKSVSREEIRGLMKVIGIDDDVTPTMLEHINYTVDGMEGLGISKFQNLQETTDTIAIQLGVNADNTSRAAIQEFLQSHQDTLKNNALRAFETNTMIKDQLIGASNHVRDSFVASSKSEIVDKRYQQGMVASMLNSMDVLVKLSHVQTLDKHVTQRFARAYLVFGGYGVFNVVESAIKTILAGHNPLFRHSPHQKLQIGISDLSTYVPIEMMVADAFNLSVGDPEPALAALVSTPSRRGSGLTGRAQKILKDHTEAFNEGRLSQRLWDDVKTITGYNASNVLTGKQKANHLIQEYHKTMRTGAPTTMEALDNIVIEATAPLDILVSQGKMSKGVAEGLREALAIAAYTGDPRIIESIPDIYTIGKVRASEVSKSLDNFNQLPQDIKVMFENHAEIGDLWERDMITRLQAMGEERIWEHHFSSPELFRKQYKAILDSILEDTPVTAEEFATKAALIDDSATMFRDTISTSAKAAVAYARTLRDSRASGRFYDEFWAQRILPQVTEISTDIERSVNEVLSRLKTPEAVDLLPQAARDQYTIFLRNTLAKSTAMKQARQGYINTRNSFMREGGVNYQSVGKGRTDSWWQDFFRSTSEPWDNAYRQVEDFESNIIASKMALTGQRIPAPPDISDGVINRWKVAQVFGVHVQDLERSVYMTDLMALMDRDVFISTGMRHVRFGASTSGKTPEALGWSSEVFGDVYDQMVSKLRHDPTNQTAVEPMMHELNASVQEIHKIGIERGALFSEEALPTVREVTDAVVKGIFPQGSASETSIVGTREVVNVAFPLMPAQRVRVQQALPSGDARIQGQFDTLSSVGEAARKEAIDIQTSISTGRDKIQAAPKRYFISVVNYLDDLEKRGVDISRANSALLDYAIILETSTPQRFTAKEVAFRGILSEVLLPEGFDTNVLNALRDRIGQAIPEEELKGILASIDAPANTFQRLRARGFLVRQTGETTETTTRQRTMEEFIEAGGGIQTPTGPQGEFIPEARVLEQRIQELVSDSNSLRNVEARSRYYFEATGEFSLREEEFLEHLLDKDIADITLDDVIEAVRTELGTNETAITKARERLATRVEMDLEAEAAAIQRGVELVGAEVTETRTTALPSQDIRITVPDRFTTDPKFSGLFRHARARTFPAPEIQKAWDEMLGQLNLLDIDVEATVRAARTQVQGGFTPGTPGGPALQDVPPRTATVHEANTRRGEGLMQVERIVEPDYFRQAPAGRETIDQRLLAEGQTPGISIPEEVPQPSPEAGFYRRSVEAKIGPLEGYTPLQNVRNRKWWKAFREDCLQEANRVHAQDFPDYTNQTAISNVMRMIFPFWGYEAHRWNSWLPREFLRHPGVWAGWGKYQDHTDQGYINIPGTPLDINPFRGTIFMGGARRLMQRDFPEYFDTFEGFSETFDYMSRWGFFPGVHVGLIQSTFGAAAGGKQFGQLLPPIGNLFLDSISAISPKHGQTFRDVIFSDNFHDFMQAREVDRLLSGTDSLIDGATIVNKRLENIPLTKEEEAVWNRANRGVSMWQLLFEQTGLFRFNPEERRRLREAVAAVLHEEYGVPLGVLDDMARTGTRFEDVFDLALSADTKMILNNLENYRRFSATNALIPSKDGIARQRIERFWERVNTNVELEREKLSIQEARFERGEITYKDWQAFQDEKIGANIKFMDDLKKDPIYEHVPVTLDERRAFAEETGVKLFFSPEEELRELYFSYELEEVMNEVTGLFEKNYDKLYAFRGAVLGALTEEQRQKMFQFMNQNDSDLERLKFQVTQEYIRPYNLLSDAVLAGFNPQEQNIINKARSGAARGDIRADLRAETNEQGDRIVAAYEAQLSQIRENFREGDPLLDAWLLFFERTLSTKTNEANEIYNGLIERMRTDGINSLLP